MVCEVLMLHDAFAYALICQIGSKSCQSKTARKEMGHLFGTCIFHLQCSSFLLSQLLCATQTLFGSVVSLHSEVEMLIQIVGNNIL